MTDEADARKWRAMADTAQELARWHVCARKPEVVRELLDLARSCETRAGNTVTADVLIDA